MSPARSDALIVGGGIMGCALAYQLARRGVGVTLIERGELNEQSSGSNAGSLHVQMLCQLARLDDPAMMAAVERTLALHAAGVRDWQQLAAALPDPIELQVNGGVTVAMSEEDYRFLGAKVARESRSGVTVHLLDAASARDVAPYLAEGAVGVAYCPDEGRVNPALATTAIARAAGRLGASFVPHAPLRALRRSGARFVADAGGREITADIVVNAAGPWADTVGAMLDVVVPMAPGILQMNVSEVAPKFLPHLVQHASQRLTIKQASNGNVIIGGGWPGRLDDAGRPQVVRASIAGNLRVACSVVPDLAGFNLLRSWAALVSRVPDHNPILGAVDRVPGFFQALAIPNGYTLGPICARLLAEQITGARPDWDMVPFSPARFN